ncbi:hypothetical protein F5Y02DRAFT_157426 [Annulohypoxylon stygium]|nr:hypothetical protein F5Y02DRAFT_157426 [Annulohypoxylon stygium]
MVQFVCQTLTYDNQPIVGMRVTCAPSDALYTFEGVSSSNGIIDTWHQTWPSQLYSLPVNQEYTRCYFAFATEEYFRTKEIHVPWPAIHVDINLKAHLSNYVLLRCDPHGYNLSTSSYNLNPPESSIIDFHRRFNSQTTTEQMDLDQSRPLQHRQPLSSRKWKGKMHKRNRSRGNRNKRSRKQGSQGIGARTASGLLKKRN